MKLETQGQKLEVLVVEVKEWFLQEPQAHEKDLEVRHVQTATQKEVACLRIEETTDTPFGKGSYFIQTEHVC